MRNSLKTPCVGIAIAFLFIFLQPLNLLATHMRAGNILVRKIGDCNNFLYEIMIVAYVDTGSDVPFGGAETDYLLIYGSSGEPKRIKVPEISPRNLSAGGTYTVIDAALKIARVTYTIQYDFRGNDTYTLTYTEFNRNEGILNMSKSVDTPFYLETQLLIDIAGMGCGTPPQISIPPIDQACSGIAWMHNPGATDLTPRDSISYERAIPYAGKSREVLNYRFPDNAVFYSNYNEGNENHDGPPTYTIDPVDGLITWNAPDAPGEYNIAFHIVEWRRDRTGRWRRIGFVRRDMQIIVKDDCNNERPELNIPEDICVRAGDAIDTVITAKDKPYQGNFDWVKIEAFSPLFSLTPPSIAATKTNEGVYRLNPEMEFHWQTTCADVKEQPYMVVFKATDNNPHVRLATFKTWRIRVVGPEPKFNDRIANNDQSVTLKWNAYTCNNAQTMQVWRRVDSVAYTPDKCETGMPPSLGYELIATVPASDTEYTDRNGGEGLSSGARYCYRIVAIFSSSNGESIVSSDTCIAPMETPDPIITNVSVLKTDATAGQVRVKWRKPLHELFAPPYKYEVWRGEGFTRGNDSVLVATLDNITPGKNNTYDSITDVSPGLDTENKVYNYSIVVYRTTSAPTGFGFSKPASIVRLTHRAQVGKIMLSWSAKVPWSNVVAGTKYHHKIYRGAEGSTDEQLVAELAAVDVTNSGLNYTDEGPLEEGKVYCYRIETYGSYGNPEIIDPLINRSQKLCARPGDDDKPCNPSVTVDSENCADKIGRGELCDANVFINTITWEHPVDDPNCDDVAEYIIYRASRKNGSYMKYDSVPSTATSYTDRNLVSYAQCYKIRAKDYSGNISEFSNEVCKDNCPYYAIPNVFTPNGDGKNDDLNAYDITRYCVGGETGECEGVPEVVKINCPRFVDEVSFHVYNRWGAEVYNYHSDNTTERGIYINWTGKDNNGVLLAAGVYYYMVEVKFDSVDPDNNIQIKKGWLHLAY